MTVLLAVAALAYAFPKGQPIDYNVNVSFEGFLPVFGGQDGTAEIALGLRVEGLAPDDKGRAQASSDLTEAKVKFQGETLPFTVDNVKGFFPKTTVSYEPSGKLAKTDAPDIQLPIRLPGLDVKRFPELTYLPVELPSVDIEVGKPWTFKRTIGGAEATYTVTPTALTDELATLKVGVTQTETTFENEALELTKEEEAKYKVITTLSGDGQVLFDRKAGYARKVNVTVVANGVETEIKSGAKKDRKLTTKLTVELKPVK